MRTATRAAATALAALVLAACGTDDDESGATTAADRTAQAATTSVEGGSTTAEEPGATATTAAAEGFRLVPVADGFDQPVLVTSPPDDPRLFVVEQTGRVWVLRGGRRLPTPFLDVRDDIVSGGEQGLLGLAFAPDFARTGTVVVNYTNREGDTRIVSFRAPGGGDRVEAASARDLLAIDQPYPNHNGGHVTFGPDGMLWIGMGDGGSAGDPEGRAQNPDELLGKLLRVDVRRPGGGLPYGIPADNPFADGGGAAEIWAVGLRNPWRFSFDPETGDLWSGDVGQQLREEINRVRGPGPAGTNYGWDVFEGRERFTEDADEPADHVAPVAEYDHDDGCSVTGGVVVRDPALPALAGRYLFSDYCSGFLRAIDAADPAAGAEDLTARVGGSLGNVSSFGTDAQGRVYVVEHGGGIRRFEPTSG